MDSEFWTQVFLLIKQASYQQSYFLSSFWVFIMVLSAFIGDFRWELPRTVHKSWSRLTSSQTRTAADKPVQGRSSHSPRFRSKGVQGQTEATTRWRHIYLVARARPARASRKWEGVQESQLRIITFRNISGVLEKSPTLIPFLLDCGVLGDCVFCIVLGVGLCF